MINRIYTSHSILKKIELHQKYLGADNFINIIKNKEKSNEEVFKYVEDKIESYHLNNLCKSDKGQAKFLIDYLKEKDRDVNFIRRIWKGFEISNNMYKLTSMVIENSFITPYKIAIFNKKYNKC